MALSKKLRFEIFKRDLFSCQYCGKTPPGIILEVDHITPVSKGGKNEEDNLITSCFDCNRGKSDRLLNDIPKSLRDKSIELAEREAQIKGYHDIMESKRIRIEEQTWEIATVLDSDAENGFSKSWMKSISVFIDKIGFHETLNAMEVASAKIKNNHYAFKYFCGICWNKIKNS